MNRRDLITQRKADRKGCLPFMACRYYVNGWPHSVQKRFPWLSTFPQPGQTTPWGAAGWKSPKATGVLQ